MMKSGVNDEGSSSIEKMSSAAVENYLTGVQYPAQKEELVSQAEENGAPQSVLGVLNQLEDKEYKTIGDVAKEISGTEEE